MGASARSDGEGRTAPGGSLTALLEELAAAPAEDLGAAFPAFHPGQRIGRFELLREIGRGGFGVVYAARDVELGREVAFKAVRVGGGLALREERLLHEAEAAARLSHPNVVTLLDAGRSEQGPYLVLELLRGRTLAARLAEGPAPPREALGIALEVAKGIAHAHAHGVTHRDLTPGNVFLCEDGHVKILDLGLAHAFGRRKAEGGTSAYMAPEQLRGAPEDERTDVFALGVILYQLLSGELPFGGDAASGRRRPAPRLPLAVDPGARDLVARMLETDPIARPRDGAEVVAALRALLDGRATPSPGVRRARARRWPRLGPTPRASRWVRASRMIHSCARCAVIRATRPCSGS